MDLYIKSKNKNVDAHAVYNPETGNFVVCKGSIISNKISQGSFRSAKSVEKQRNSDSVEGNILVEDMEFKSASSAANFVNGTSTNGMIAWKDKNGIPFKDLK